MKAISFQCNYHYGPEVVEPPVCIEVTHSRRSGVWQHQGVTCKACRGYLRGQFRRCRIPVVVTTTRKVGHAEAAR